MVIILLLLFQLFLLLRETRFNKTIILIVLSSLVWNVGWLCILHFELLGLGTSSYGSDETAYYNTMLQAFKSDNWFQIVRDDFNFSYVLFGTLILKTSFYPSIFFIRLGNVLLLINTLLFVFLLLNRTYLIKSKILYWALLFIGFNGIVTWTAIRNLKDIMFIYFLAILIYFLLDWIIHKRWSILRVISMGVALFILEDIRQWFPYMIIATVALIVLVRLFQKKRYILAAMLISVATITTIPLFKNGLSTLLIYTVTYSEFTSGGNISSLINSNIFSLPLSMGRFILGPGPIRGLFGVDSFLTYTTTGNILITFGGLMWWAVLPFFILALLSIKNIKRMYPILFILLFYWAMYSYSYAGSGDTRLRAILYLLCAIYTVPFLYTEFRKKMIPLYVAILFIIVTVGSYFSYVSLA
ncbi:hypothetical protein [Paenibacillus paeoniae]|uniref:Glycosyltransferase RgtA/B/C/D-like domain-containing protein n=1 Tax=Paenibacillus paeoniae TaxID=2292705 RepID=A0A371P147_9BACL|nr:hypothetical protein [Paenibacillus paeoniae]REK69280.1 hypothetical protein DX130_25550 [Paenibacillus paeoniae]